MINLDAMNKKKTDIMQSLSDAVKANDTEKMQLAMNDWQSYMTDAIMAEAKSVLGAADSAILASRGARQLTSAEKSFYNKFIEKAKMAVAEGSVITGIGDALPETIIEAVFDDLRTAHPLLDAINFQNTTAVTKIVVNKSGAQTATWNALNEPITQQLTGEIEIISLTLCKLTAYMWVTMDMLDLGPAWLDRYVRETLSEALATALETAIVDGNGINQPIGFTRNFAGALDPTDGYARKDAVTVNDLGKETYGTLLSTLSQSPTGRTRTINEVILVVNPTDYFSKIMPATTLLRPDGTYANNVFPFPTKVIQSAGVPSGHAVIGLADKYFMGMGTAKEGKIEYSDEYKFLEDLRTYKIKLYGMGKPLDINAFIYLDISDIKSALPEFKIKGVSPENPSADLTDLSVGFTLTPAFDRDTTTYTATATSASSVVTAIPKDGDAEILIKNGATTVTNGSSVSWTNNAVSTLTVTITNETASKTYTVSVTRGTP